MTSRYDGTVSRLRMLVRIFARHRHHKRHVNQPLLEFGITEDEIRRDLAFVYEGYLKG